MCPSYLALAGPIALARDVPALLWFAHPSVTAWLRAADRVATAILTSLPGAYPLPGPKVRAIGQAIDVDRFPWTPPARSDGYRILALGRTSPSKGFSTIIRAVGIARRDGLDARLRIAGPSTTREERAHRAVLERELAVHLRHAGSIEGGLPPSDVPRAIADADTLVNAMVPGSGDKVVFEAAAMGRPVLASNPAFASLLGDLPLNLRFPPGDARRLADLIADVAAAGDRDVGQLTRTLRSRVERDHSLAHWASEVMRAGEETERILEGRGTGRGTRDRHAG